MRLGFWWGCNMKLLQVIYYTYFPVGHNVPCITHKRHLMSPISSLCNSQYAQKVFGYKNAFIQCPTQTHSWLSLYVKIASDFKEKDSRLERQESSPVNNPFLRIFRNSKHLIKRFYTVYNRVTGPHNDYWQKIKTYLDENQATSRSHYGGKFNKSYLTFKAVCCTTKQATTNW